MSKLGGDRHLESCMFVPKEKKQKCQSEVQSPR